MIDSATPDKLSIKQVEEFISNQSDTKSLRVRIAKQLADTLRENERLRKEVREYEDDMAKLAAMTQQK